MNKIKFKKHYKMALKQICKCNGKNYLFKKIIESQNYIDVFNYLYDNNLDDYTIENSIYILYEYYDKLWYWKNNIYDDFIYIFENESDNYIIWIDDFFESHLWGNEPFNYKYCIENNI